MAAFARYLEEVARAAARAVGHERERARTRRRRHRALLRGRERIPCTSAITTRSGASPWRRPPPVREGVPRRVPVRPELAHHPPQARELPEGVRALRSRARRPLRRRARGAPPRRRRASCATAARSSPTINNARRALELREEKGSLAAYFWEWGPGRRSAAPSHPAALRAMAHDARLRRAQPRPAPRGWTLRGPDDALRVHAGHGPGQRPPRRMRRRARAPWRRRGTLPRRPS